jgi:hypothetical protein
MPSDPQPQAQRLVRLVRVGNVDGAVFGAVLPAEHHGADLDGYGIKAAPAAWALLETLVAALTADDGPGQVAAT